MPTTAAESASKAQEAGHPAGRDEWILRWSLILLVFLSFFQNGITILIDVKVRMIGFLILIILFAKGLLAPRPRLRLFEKAMLAWVGTGILSGFFGFRFGLEGKVAYAFAYNLISEFGWIMAFFAGRYAAARGVDFRKILGWSLFFGIILTAVAIVEKFFHEYIELYLLANSQNAFIQENFNSIFRRGYGYDESAYRCVSFVLEFIAFSYLCGVLALAFLIFFLEYRKPWQLLGLITSISALFLTQSLSSLVAFCFCALVYLLVGKRVKISNLFYLSLAAGVFMAAFSFQEEGAGPFDGIQQRIEGVISGDDHGLVTHFQEFQYGVIENFEIFGHGLGTSDFLHAQLGKEMREAEHPTIEHEYFRILYEVGGFGFLIYLLAVLLAAKESTAIYLRESDPWRKCVAAICVLWFLLHFLVGFAHRSFPTYESTILPALLFGFLCATPPGRRVTLSGIKG